MKPGFLTLLTVALVAGLVGSGVTLLLCSAQSVGQYSAAGQTLANLSRAIEAAKQHTGHYPDSITQLKVEDSGGDFSAKLLENVIYFRMEKGYIAFIGCPDVAYIHSGSGAEYK